MRRRTCRSCRSDEVRTMLDFGMQPLSNRFLKSPEKNEPRHRLAIGFCHACGVLQLTDTFPANELIPPHKWLSYTEPEKHLDKLADALSKLPGIEKDAPIFAISYKDDSLLRRMEKLGFKNVARLNPREDLGAEGDYEGVELIQNLFSAEKARGIAEKKGKFGIVIARHILEHSYDTLDFMNGIKELLKPGGHAVFEVPDCTLSMEKLDYSMVWEEHPLYLTPETFRNCLAMSGFSTDRLETYHYPLENSLVAITKAGNTAFSPDKEAIQKEEKRAKAFAQEFEKRKAMLKSFFSGYNGKIAVFGAGHSASAIINLFGLENIACVADDNEKKHGLLMPGSHLPIVSSDVLEKDIDLCVLSVNPEAEEKIIAKKNRFRGSFLSFSPASRRSIYANLAHLGNPAKFREVSKEVYYTTESSAKLYKEDISLFKEKSRNNERGKSRICTHESTENKLHEMFIVFRKGAYVRPHKHLDKLESFHVVEGSAYVVTFDEQGGITNLFEIGDYQSGKNFYCRMAGPAYHTLIIKSDYLAFHEATTGPFRKSDTVHPAWSPEEGDKEGIKKFMDKLEASVKRLLEDRKNG